MSQLLLGSENSVTGKSNMVMRQHEDLGPGMEKTQGFKEPAFYTSPHCPQLVKVAKHSQPPASSEDIPFLCAASLALKHGFKKICPEISLGFLLSISVLGNPRTPTW